MIFLLIPVLLVLFVLSAFFSASETVLFSLTPLQVRRISDHNAGLGHTISAWLVDPARALSTILAGNTLVNFAIASFGYLLFEQLLPSYAEAVSVPLFTVLLLLFGEIAPKQFAMRNAERLAPFCVRALSFWTVALAPFAHLMAAGTRVFRNLLSRERRALSDDELRAVVDSAAASGVLDSEEASMVDGILRLSELSASDEMTPRVDIVGVEASMPRAEKVRLVLASPYPFLPVYRKTPDAIEGFLNVQKLILDPDHDLAAATEDALFVPENVGLDDLLVTFRRSGRRIAVVLDEYGGTAGLITRGDILELITEPVNSSPSRAGEPIVPDGPGAWLCSGTVALEELNRELGLALEADDADRLAGWMMFFAGRIPHVGQTVKAQGVHATVVRRRNRRILTVRLVRATPGGADEPDPAEEIMTEDLSRAVEEDGSASGN